MSDPVGVEVRKPMGRPRKYLLSESDYGVIERAAGLGLTEEFIAELVGMNPKTFNHRKRKDARVAEAMRLGKAKVQLAVAQALVTKCRTGDVAAIKWFEQTRAEKREVREVAFRAMDVKAMTDEELERLAAGEMVGAVYGDEEEDEEEEGGPPMGEGGEIPQMVIGEVVPSQEVGE